MEVKGTSIEATLEHVRGTFGDDGLKRLLSTVSERSREILTQLILPSTWYPMGPGLLEPTRAICDLFHDGDLAGAWEVGRASADTALTGIYKALLVFVSPKTVVERGPGILATYFRPIKTTVRQLAPSRYSLGLGGIDEPSPVFDRRVAGWTERALEMAGAKDIQIEIVSSAADGADMTDIHFVWK